MVARSGWDSRRIREGRDEKRRLAAHASLPLALAAVLCLTATAPAQAPSPTGPAGLPLQSPPAAQPSLQPGVPPGQSVQPGRPAPPAFPPPPAPGQTGPAPSGPALTFPPAPSALPPQPPQTGPRGAPAPPGARSPGPGAPVSPLPPGSPGLAPSPSGLGPSSGLDPDNLPDVVARNLFSPERKPNLGEGGESAEPAQPTAKLPPGAVQLDAVFIVGGKPVALVRVDPKLKPQQSGQTLGQTPGARPGAGSPFSTTPPAASASRDSRPQSAASPYMTVREGDKIGDYSVARITINSLKLDRADGQSHTVELFAQNKVRPEMPASGGLPAPSSGPTLTPPGGQPGTPGQPADPVIQQPDSAPGEQQPPMVEPTPQPDAPS